VMPIEPLKAKYESFGWHVLEVDGHNIEEFVDAVEEVKAIYEKPTVIIAKTIKGKGVSFMENVADFHGRVPSQEEAKLAVKELLGEV